MERRERQDSNLRFRRNQPAFYRLNYTPIKAVAHRTWTTAWGEIPAPKCFQDAQNAISSISCFRVIHAGSLWLVRFLQGSNFYWYVPVSISPTQAAASSTKKPSR